MKKLNGYSLVELLVVISVISILGIAGYANFKKFSADQVTKKAITEVQSVLRLAQGNATSSTLCSGLEGKKWSVIFNSGNLDLSCGGNPPGRTYTLQKATIDSIIGSDCGVIPLNLPATFNYTFGVGTLIVSSTGATSACLLSGSWTFTLKNIQDGSTRSFKLSKGGAIDVQ